MKKTKVQMPQWWTESDHTVYGYTDKRDTYCCSAEKTWFVEVPEFEYEGYFNIKDLKVIKEIK